MTTTYSKIRLGRFFILLMIIAHWLACLWAFTLMLVPANQRVPRWVDSFADLEVSLSEESKTVNTPWKLYVASFYFACYTLTSVGFGDIGPQNTVERLVCT